MLNLGLEIYERVKALAKENNMTMTDLQQTLGFSRSLLSKWRGGILPSAAILLKLADYFHVSTDYLLCRTNHRKIFTESKPMPPLKLELMHKIESADYGNEQITAILSLIEYAEEFNEGEDE